MAKVNLTTENSIVNAVGKMAITGNIIPESWYKTVVSPNGRVNLLAVNLLADIVYWYRPMEIRDEMTGDVTWKKKFADDDYLQRNYSKICEKYNVSTKQAREALIVLETLGVVKRHFRTIETEMGKCPNVMYIELIPDALYKLTYPEHVLPLRSGQIQRILQRLLQRLQQQRRRAMLLRRRWRSLLL